ncbi:hypothetical protein AVEN_83789-1 [Araneus ventricosus]|uniref:Uncharacterized protein n=1 Tax=Araneus ventricosus TaxID=182803 RepID=A0A4Y2S353_ARAVE|nr:hypothetical protein AVEN_83789-1 [Araneus ventricosus]
MPPIRGPLIQHPRSTVSSEAHQYTIRVAVPNIPIRSPVIYTSLEVHYHHPKPTNTIRGPLNTPSEAYQYNIRGPLSLLSSRSSLIHHLRSTNTIHPKPIVIRVH